jgi:hypothetical protein
MNRCVLVLLVFAGITGTVSLIGCCCDDAEDDLSPLVVNTDAPLLLAEPGEYESSSARPATNAEAENPACFVCHANYTEEKLVVSHAGANVGCTECHGKSYPHRNDENHLTPPDRMFPRETIRPSCMKCHPQHDAIAEKIAALKKQRNLGDTDFESIACTQCHGSHGLKTRTVRWNKSTGDLIPRDAR